MVGSEFELSLARFQSPLLINTMLHFNSRRGEKKKTRKRLPSTALALCLFGLLLAHGIKHSFLRKEVNNEMTRKIVAFTENFIRPEEYFNHLIRGCLLSWHIDNPAPLLCLPYQGRKIITFLFSSRKLIVILFYLYAVSSDLRSPDFLSDSQNREREREESLQHLCN